MPATTPSRVFQADARTLGIEWGDGKECRYEVRTLRLACTCAGCVDEWSGERRLAEDTVPEDVHPVALENVGLYGLRVDWSDGHNTGIYTYDHLRALCEGAAGDA